MLHNGVEINEFDLSGNRVRGFVGDLDEYQSFLVNSNADVVMFYAAQQWTFDAAWPVLSHIKAKKVLVPCGYSGFYNPSYKIYFSELVNILKLFDAVVYHAEEYRDINFSKRHQINNDVFIPNAADINEFSISKDTFFRNLISVDNDTFIILTVGTLTGSKGHLELVKAYSELDLKGRKSLLILNGNQPELNGNKASIYNKISALAKIYGYRYTVRHIVKSVLIRCGLDVGNKDTILSWAQKINKKQSSHKKVIVTDFNRKDLVQAYLNSDLFVFASNIEYSPLVLFEACAAGLPFLTVPVGNSEEITKWTGGGEMCEAEVDESGYTRVSPTRLAARIEEMAFSTEKLKKLGQIGLEMSTKKYNWDVISREYESLFQSLTSKID